MKIKIEWFINKWGRRRDRKKILGHFFHASVVEPEFDFVTGWKTKKQKHENFPKPFSTVSLTVPVFHQKPAFCRKKKKN